MNFEVFAEVNYADPLIKRNNLVMTTGGAGGLITPYKGIVTDTP